MSKDDFAIVLNSSVGVLDSNQTNSSLNYSFDFSPFKEGLYELTFTFVSANNTVGSDSDTLVSAAFLYINFGGSQNYRVSNSIAAAGSNFIGICYPIITFSFDGYLTSKWKDNPPTVISRPINNIFNVLFLDITNSLWVDSNNDEMSRYNLVLKFRKIPDI
jgi:hypothetical protein